MWQHQQAVYRISGSSLQTEKQPNDRTKHTYSLYTDQSVPESLPSPHGENRPNLTIKWSTTSPQPLAKLVVWRSWGSIMLILSMYII